MYVWPPQKLQTEKSFVVNIMILSVRCLEWETFESKVQWILSLKRMKTKWCTLYLPVLFVNIVVCVAQSGLGESSYIYTIYPGQDDDGRNKSHYKSTV